MPILLALFAGFLFGVTFAWLARTEFARIDAPLVATRPFAVVLAFAGLIYTPILGYFVAFHGDWTYGYTVSWHDVPSAVDLALAVAAGGSTVAGMAISAHSARARRLQSIAWLGAVPAIGFVATLLWGAPRLSVSATYAEFHGGFGVLPIGSSSLGRSVLLMAIMLVLGIAWTVRALRQGDEGAKRDSSTRVAVDS